ncbi:MAG: response regulator transcription factor, partial [Firmicutes bacterium]|nr:response regulator transcription factor [Bacillota bacterium]
MKIVFIDDHPLVRKGPEMVLSKEEDFDIVGFADSGQKALEILDKTRPDVALVDLRLPGEHGLDIIKKAKEIHKDCKFIVLTSFATEEEIRRALDEEVDGYILKESLPEELINAVRMVYKGRKYYDPVVVQYALSRSNSSPKTELDSLTPREQEVLAALA